MKLDIVIIGAGPIGLACGIAAQKAGFSYQIIEKGCLVNSLFNYPANMTFFSTAERLEIGDIPFTCLHSKPNRAEALEYYRRVTAWYDLQVRLFEAVQTVERVGGDFLVTTSRQVLQARKIIIATGFYDIPVRLGVPGENLEKVTHYYKDPHYYAFQQVLVVGGNNSAVDAALETWHKGAKVTMVMQEPDVGERVKYWVRPDVINRIKEGSIQAYTHSKVSAIRPYEVDLMTPTGLVTIPNDFVLAMTGYQPNFKWLQSLGIQLSDDGRFHPNYNPATMETNQPGIYLAGVVCGGLDTHVWFIENSRNHAQKIVDHLLEIPQNTV